MSFYGFDPFVDDITISRYASEGEGEAPNEQQSNITEQQQPQEDSTTYSFMSLESADASSNGVSMAIFLPPRMIDIRQRLQEHQHRVVSEDDELGDDENEASSSLVSGGATILSSVPSSCPHEAGQSHASASGVMVAAVAPAETDDIYSVPSIATAARHSSSSIQQHRFRRSTLASISTTDSVYVDAISPPSTSSLEPTSLSLHPSSLASSIMTNLSLHDDYAVLSSETTTHTLPLPSPTAITSLPRFGTTGSSNVSVRSSHKQQHCNEHFWYTHFRSERDWEAFRDCTLQLLAVVGEPMMECPDLVLARLIEQEERLFWKEEPNANTNNHTDRSSLQRGRLFVASAKDKCQQSALLLGVVATAAAASFAILARR